MINLDFEFKKITETLAVINAKLDITLGLRPIECEFCKGHSIDIDTVKSSSKIQLKYTCLSCGAVAYKDVKL